MFIFVFVLWFFIARSIKASRKILIGGYVVKVSFLFLLIFLAFLDIFSNFGLHYILQHPFWVFDDLKVIGALWSAVVASLLFGAIFGILTASLLCYFLYD